MGKVLKEENLSCCAGPGARYKAQGSRIYDMKIAFAVSREFFFPRRERLLVGL